MHAHVAVQQYSQQCVFKYMNSNEGLKYEIYPRYCFVPFCNHLPEKVQSHTLKQKRGTCNHSFNLFCLFFFYYYHFCLFYCFVAVVFLSFFFFCFFFVSLGQALGYWEQRNEKTL